MYENKLLAFQETVHNREKMGLTSYSENVQRRERGRCTVYLSLTPQLFSGWLHVLNKIKRDAQENRQRNTSKIPPLQSSFQETMEKCLLVSHQVVLFFQNQSLGSRRILCYSKLLPGRGILRWQHVCKQSATAAALLGSQQSMRQ